MSRISPPPCAYSTNQRKGAGFKFDANGNPTLYNGTAVSYDAENQMTSFGSTLRCGYRADGQRAWKQSASGVKTYFLYDGSDVIGEFDAKGNFSTARVYGPDGLVGAKSASLPYSHAFAYDIQGNLVDSSVPATGSYARTISFFPRAMVATRCWPVIMITTGILSRLGLPGELCPSLTIAIMK